VTHLYDVTPPVPGDLTEQYWPFEHELPQALLPPDPITWHREFTQATVTAGGPCAAHPQAGYCASQMASAAANAAASPSLIARFEREPQQSVGCEIPRLYNLRAGRVPRRSACRHYRRLPFLRRHRRSSPRLRR